MKRLTLCLTLGLSAAAMLVLAACDSESKVQAKGFHLPAGDIEVGKTLFVELKCFKCHSVAGVKIPDDDLPSLPEIILGGEVNRVKSYGELVTSIISPEHVVSPKYLAILSEEEKKRGAESPMPVFNEEMTVQQLIDLVAFLHSRYKLIEPTYDEYYYIMP